ncbi:MAG: glycosyltransferase family 2 protein [Patescibacteria group bacterium]
MIKTNLDLSIIILNYNAKSFLPACLGSIKPAKGINYEIIVVDNNSTDGSQDFLKNLKIKNLKTIFNSQNLGFATGNNVGVKNSSGRYLLFLNPDTIVGPKAVETALSFAKQHSRAGAISVKIELTNGKMDQGSHRGFPTPWRAFCHFSGLSKLFPQSKLFAGYQLGHLKNSPDPHQIDSCCGAFLLVSRLAGDKVGWWDENYFFYGEDIDLCYRLVQAGYQNYFLPQAKITHFWGGSSGIKKDSQKISQASLETKIRSAKMSTKAMEIFYQKHYAHQYPTLITSLVLLTIRILTVLRIALIKRR